MELQFTPIEETVLLAFTIMALVAVILIAWSWVDKHFKK
jgi:hypothetical protein